MIESSMKRLVLLAGVLTLAANPVGAQGFDRTKPPALRSPAPVRMPPVETATLANGLKLYVVEMHEVPVVQFTLTVGGGGRLDQGAPGIASFTAEMLDEGAGTRDALGIASEAAFLGASLGTSADWDASYVSLKTPRRTMNQSLDLLADVALRPTFKQTEVTRQRDLRLANILQQRDQPNSMASLAFNALLFPANHPYHQPLSGDSASTASLDSARVRSFYDATFAPGRTALVVTGDVTMTEVRRAIESRFGAWKGHPSAVASSATPPAIDRETSVFLVDKPGAAQSVIWIGSPGIERNNPDFAAIEVMNNLLGGSFSSRLNQNLRETKGYTYGAGSGYLYRPVPGPFIARSAVRTNVTDSSLIEFFKEFDRLRNEPVDSVEVERAKAYIALGLASDFETTTQLSGQVGNLVRFGLPFTYYNDFIPRIMKVTAADVHRVADEYVKRDRFTVVVVGDLATIRPGIEALKLGPVSVRDMLGNEIH
ncbi:MAG: pitrilysin family protein [Gemmatimonadota bacterium]